MPVNAGFEDSQSQSSSEEAPSLPINELFYSLQGEGELAGTPTVFIRTSGCNLRCWFCDSYHTSWEPTHAWMSLDEILAEVKDFEQATHVVVTGGEPLIHDDCEILLKRLSEQGYHTTVETNGTVYRDTAIDLASISPKLESSNPTAEKDPSGDGDWEDRHDQRRLDIEVLGDLLETYNSQLKFVVTGPDDLPEIQSLVDRVRRETQADIDSDEILLMPQGTTREELDEVRNQVAELALEYGYRYTPRLHVDLWEDAPGT
ncbi:7-carboxy-7-deazaguanine synthase QueE [Halosimplex halophilum]|uniref:7-carboxy-7-deazaguanine synthase QueE n=1 Tax=Halosimplex halophilum TaxID=2559572 RepID=UPI00107FC496|nr:7-carboxy-7-deazaguanine synthase QueE [Halosimplex halophilum]